MSTRSFIASQKGANQGYEGAYCHWDGYPAFNGKILLENYSHDKKLQKLLSHGDMSSLGKKVGSKHSFDKRAESVTTYYGRDRGEQGTDRFYCDQLDRLLRHAEDCGCEFIYLFSDGEWTFAGRGLQFFGESDGTKFTPLEPLLPEDTVEYVG